MKYYHLVTRIPMTEGQIIDFTGENYNRLYDFWMKREAHREGELVETLLGGKIKVEKIIEEY